MMQSPACIRPASVWTVCSVIAPAGSITQAARGTSSLETRSSRLDAPIAPASTSAGDGRRVLVEHHGRVPVPQKAPDDVAAHPAEADHAELHCRSPQDDPSPMRGGVKGVGVVFRVGGGADGAAEPRPKSTPASGLLPARGTGAGA